MSSSAVATVRPSDPPVRPDQMLPAAPASPSLFASDLPDDGQPGREASARLLADLASHPHAGTPFLIAIHGSAGSGKSSLLRQIVARVRDAGNPGDATSQPLAVIIDASAGGDAAADLVPGVLGALRTRYPALAEDAMHAGDNPFEAARAASDRVSALRRQLDAERQALDDLGGRQARLADTVLFNAPASRVDAYARANRGRIEGRLRAFGLLTSDPITTYKELVRDAAESEGGASRSGVALRSLWAYKGQGTLILLAVLLLLVGWSSNHFGNDPDLSSKWLNGLGEHFSGMSTWAQDHATLLVQVSHAAYALAALAILVDILRAFRFIQPVMRGASLLNGDIESRRRDIEGLLAHQTRRVARLAGETDAAVGRAEAAERRAESRRGAGASDPEFGSIGADPGVPASPRAAAETALAVLSAAIARAVGRISPSPSPGDAPWPAPSRIVVALDELDRLAPQAAAHYLDTAQKLLARTGFVVLAAVERKHVLDGFSETDPAYAAARLGRCAQLCFDLDAETLAAETLDEVPGAAAAPAGALERPLQDYERLLLRDLVGFAGPTPRARKRFTNTYRVARADPRMGNGSPAEHAGLAVALALDESAASAELAAYEANATDAGGGTPGSTSGRAIALAQAAVGHPFNALEAGRGFRVARIYSRRG